MKKQSFSDSRIPFVYLGIGSNLGSRKENIIRGFSLLNQYFEDLETSSLYETEPMYMTDQPRFLNTVFRGRCLLSPDKLLENIHEIEAELGRDRDKAGFKGPRPLDIDILLFGDLLINTDRLIIPHPGIKERMFVMKPLTEICSTLEDPETGEKYSDIIKTVEKEGIYYYESCRYIENRL